MTKFVTSWKQVRLAVDIPFRAKPTLLAIGAFLLDSKFAERLLLMQLPSSSGHAAQRRMAPPIQARYDGEGHMILRITTMKIRTQLMRTGTVSTW